MASNASYQTNANLLKDGYRVSTQLDSGFRSMSGPDAAFPGEHHDPPHGSHQELRLVAEARTGDPIAMKKLVYAAETRPNGRNEASPRASDHLVGMICDPNLPTNARQALTTCAGTLMKLNNNSVKCTVERVPMELVYLVACSRDPVAPHATTVLEKTFGNWEQMATNGQKGVPMQSAERTVSAEELEAGAKRLGTELDMAYTPRAKPGGKPLVCNDQEHFYAKIPCTHDDHTTFLTVDPYEPTQVKRHAGLDPDSVVYGKAQGDTPNACGPIVLRLLTSLQQIRNDRELPTRDVLKARVEDHFKHWNSDKLSKSDRQWAIAGFRATMLAALAASDGFRQAYPLNS